MAREIVWMEAGMGATVLEAVEVEAAEVKAAEVEAAEVVIEN